MTGLLLMGTGLLLTAGALIAWKWEVGLPVLGSFLFLSGFVVLQLDEGD